MSQIIFNAKIWRSGLDVSVNSQKRIYNWLKIDTSNGKLLDCGQGEPPASDGACFNMNGKWIFPGFHDAHAHVEWQGRFSEPSVNFSHCQNIKQLQDKLQLLVDKVKQYTPNKWILGFGWCQDKLKQLPSREILDEVCDTIPILLYRWDCHIAVVNTKMLQMCGVDKHTACPFGGEIDYYPDSHPNAGELTGVLRETAVNLAIDKIIISPEDRKQNIIRGLNTCIQNGITSIHCCDEGCWNEYVELAKQDKLPIRCYFATWYKNFQGNEKNHPKFVGEKHGNMLISTAIKIFADGGLGSQTAALSLPYVSKDKESKPNFGILYQNQEDLNNMVKFANDRGYQLEIHTIGDKACEQVINALEHNNVDKTKRPIFVHCQVLREEFFNRMKNLGAIASIQPQFVYTDTPWVDDILPEPLKKFMYSHKTMKERGVHCAGGTDMPCNEPLPLMGVYDAIFHSDKVRDPKNKPFVPHECLSFEESIDLMTTDAAYLDWAELSVGKLEPGFQANFIVLNVPGNCDISSNPAMLLDTQIRETWVNGIKIYDLNQV